MKDVQENAREGDPGDGSKAEKKPKRSAQSSNAFLFEKRKRNLDSHSSIEDREESLIRCNLSRPSVKELDRSEDGSGAVREDEKPTRSASTFVAAV